MHWLGFIKLYKSTMTLRGKKLQENNKKDEFYIIVYDIRNKEIHLEWKIEEETGGETEPESEQHWEGKDF